MGRYDKESKDVLGSILRNARQYRGISLTSMATLTGYEKSWLSAVEMGNGKPSVELVEKYERILRIRLNPALKKTLRSWTY